ncbi:quinolinate synthase NadA [Olsenella sp. HMSC062G07]|uniref:quinolinate synthase NadA n=1 Tax=Olsenella sp. HMSC062G07 TaxID=1739330 RepID=UPI0009F198D4|nr:quinolinate synthase NadA [Olsenella sp. HMSC062G07]
MERLADSYELSELERQSLDAALRRYRERGASPATRGDADFEELRRRVEKLKRRRNAVVLAHYYVPAEVQALADHVGDSFHLARLAKTLDAEVVVMCGVSFMAQSVKLLNPHLRVLLAESRADCPMAHMVLKRDVDRVRQELGDVAVVAYVNTTAEIKSWADVCVTSSNAVKVVRELPQDNILFIPDMNLGRYVARQVPEKNVLLNRGYCPTHQRIVPSEVEELELAYPTAEVLAHPECSEEVLAEADFVGSTKQIIDHIAASEGRDFIVLTVVGIAYAIERACAGQGKRVHFPRTLPICPNMALVTAERLVSCLEGLSGEVGLPPQADAANAPLERMLELASR